LRRSHQAVEPQDLPCIADQDRQHRVQHHHQGVLFEGGAGFEQRRHHHKEEGRHEPPTVRQFHFPEGHQQSGGQGDKSDKGLGHQNPPLGIGQVPENDHLTQHQEEKQHLDGVKPEILPEKSGGDPIEDQVGKKAHLRHRAEKQTGEQPLRQVESHFPHEKFQQKADQKRRDAPQGQGGDKQKKPIPYRHFRSLPSHSVPLIVPNPLSQRQHVRHKPPPSAPYEG